MRMDLRWPFFEEIDAEGEQSSQADAGRVTGVGKRERERRE